MEDMEVLARLEFPCQMILQKRHSLACRCLTWPARALQGNKADLIRMERYEGFDTGGGRHLRGRVRKAEQPEEVMLCQARCNAYIVGKLCKDWRLVYNIIGLRVIANSLLVRSLIWVASRSPCAWSQSIVCNLRQAEFNVIVVDIRVAFGRYSSYCFLQ
jgi:hypothetical protein